MTAANMIRRECLLLERDPTGSTDDYGNARHTDSTTASVCELQQRTPNERDDSGEVSDDEYRVFFLAGTDLSTADAVQVDGAVYEFTGAPNPVVHAITGVESHIEVKARRTAGAEDGGS